MLACFGSFHRELLVQAGKLVESFTKKYQSSLPCRLIAINIIILAFAKSRQIVKVLMITEEMKEWQCKRDMITYNSVLDILGRAGFVNEMLRLFSSMKDN